MSCCRGGDGSRPAAAAWTRRLPVAGCAALALWECHSLLELFFSEPVSLSLSFTPETAVTVCCRQLRRHQQTEVVGTTPAERAWLRAEPITAAVRSCEPLCTPAANVSYPGCAARWPSRWALGPPG